MEEGIAFDNWRSLVVRVWSGRPTEGGAFEGTAFLVSPTLLVTAGHVVRDKNDVLYPELILSGVPWRSGDRLVRNTIFHPDWKVDMAVLAIAEEGRAPSVAPRRAVRSPELRPGMDVAALGFSTKDKDLEQQFLRVQSYDGIANGYVLSPFIAKGLSGGPALVGNNLAGIVWARETDKQKTYITPFTAFRDFLNSHLPTRRGPVPPPRAADPGDSEETLNAALREEVEASARRGMNELIFAVEPKRLIAGKKTRTIIAIHNGTPSWHSNLSLSIAADQKLVLTNIDKVRGLNLAPGATYLIKFIILPTSEGQAAIKISNISYRIDGFASRESEAKILKVEVIHAK